MYSNNIVNSQESTTTLNVHSKKSLETYRMQLVSHVETEIKMLIK